MRMRFDFKGDEYELEAEKIGKTLWMHFQGQTYTFEPQSSMPRGSAKINSGEVSSPMPGKVKKVLGTIGSQVRSEDTIVVVEAMKMEYNLSAGIDGTLKEVAVLEGQQVTLGQRLFLVEKSESKS